MYRYLCKLCGGESPVGIGYAFNVEGPLPAPAAGCRNLHAGDTVLRFRGFEHVPVRGVGPVIVEQPIPDGYLAPWQRAHTSATTEGN